MVNREIYLCELPWNALQLNSEDIYLSMGVGYVPDEEMLKQLDLLKKEIAVRCRPRCLYAFFEASPATKNHINVDGMDLLPVIFCGSFCLIPWAPQLQRLLYAKYVVKLKAMFCHWDMV